MRACPHLQIGWLSAFFEAFPDIEVENVYGCSVGALLSPMIANKRTDLALKLLESFADLNAVVEKWPCCLPKLCGAIFCLGAFKRFNLTDKIWKVLSAEEIATAEDKCHVSPNPPPQHPLGLRAQHCARPLLHCRLSTCLLWLVHSGDRVLTT